MNSGIGILFAAIGGSIGSAIRVALGLYLPPQDCVITNTCIINTVFNSSAGMNTTTAANSTTSTSTSNTVTTVNDIDNASSPSILLFKTFPIATFLVNIIGTCIVCFLTPLMDTYQWNSYVRTFLIGGFCGGLTTMSGFMLEIIRLYRNAYIGTSILYAILTIVTCLGMGILSYVVGTTITRSV